ncbi:phycobilisome linker polypeptide [Pseudanabaena sp. 'Roaring Creek']|uniref:phycobilisome linker polypeptide n=1 Tax=Pseudanabaena sp. 'Roaring Creek' TaxID=1681830 RepID=UPI0006D78984|nr:phycobilisome linker polypeptide [Pseudanabaena sp. 'Roaring Creek']
MISSTSTTDNRFFIYEVSGLRQNQETENSSHAIRTSSNIFMQVPYNRMNEKMRTITRLGGTIVSIRPLNNHLSAGE